MQKNRHRITGVLRQGVHEKDVLSPWPPALFGQTDIYNIYLQCGFCMQKDKEK